jgi:hypothetical protein
VSGVLDDYPLDFSRPELRTVRDVLARVFYQPRDIEGVVLEAGIDPGMVDFSGTAALQWRSILMRARAEDRVPGLLEAVGRMQPTVRMRMDELLGPRPPLEPGTGAPDELSEPDGGGWRGFGAERLVVAGTDTLLGIAFLSSGLTRSRSICLVKATYSETSASCGTGALIGPGLLLTNHHVLYDWDDGGRPAIAVEAWFGFELDEDSHTRRDVTTVRCDHTSVTGERAEDWAIVRTSDPVPSETPVLSLRGAPPPRKDDYVFIIQHPDGGPKMIGLSHNLVRHVDDNVVQYWTDTKTGSSGAPVFNSRWQVVALHHRWIEAPAGDGVSYRNQGRRIERVIAGLERYGVTVG